MSFFYILEGLKSSLKNQNARFLSTKKFSNYQNFDIQVLKMFIFIYKGGIWDIEKEKNWDFFWKSKSPKSPLNVKKSHFCNYYINIGKF